jgi:F-type H+-transporting ATPase subunit delta
MAVRLSRRKIAGYIADGLMSGKEHKRIIQELAAFLIDTRRTKELELVVRDIEFELSKRGVVLGRITSATNLTSATELAIKKLIKSETNARSVELARFIDPTVIGGVKIDLPGEQFDGTIARRLTTLRMNVKK